jgi:tetratricopeptide (TPR) repeat protein
LAFGAALASAIYPVFIRLSLLAEGARWCEAALALGSPPSATQARLQYALSMLFNNSGAYRKALSAANRAVDAYRLTDDERGLTRALSQMAQLNAREERYSQALGYAQEALQHARAIGDNRLLAATLQRSATAFDPSQIERAREQFAQCVAIFRTLGNDGETSRALNWWAESEAAAGCFERAIAISREAMPLATPEIKLYLAGNIAAYALGLDDMEQAAPAARETLTLAVRLKHPLLLQCAISFVASIAYWRDDAALAARLLGFSDARFLASESRRGPTEQVPYDKVLDRLRTNFTPGELNALMDEGAAWSEERAVAEATSVS